MTSDILSIGSRTRSVVVVDSPDISFPYDVVFMTYPFSSPQSAGPSESNVIIWDSITYLSIKPLNASIGTQMAKPGPHGKDKQRCGARVRHRHGFCRRWPVPGKERCRFHGGLSTGARTEEGKARSLAAMRAGQQRWLADMHAKKAAGEIDRFPGGRKSGAGWVTPRMWEERQIATMQRLRAAREAREPPPPPPPRRRRGRPTLIAQVQAQIVKAFVQLPEDSPLLARLHGRLGQRVAEARRELERRARRARPRLDF
jgi:hypothetical protein